MKRVKMVVLIVTLLNSIVANASLMRRPLSYPNSPLVTIIEPQTTTNRTPYRELFAQPFDVILFDADDTLFHFDAYKGLKEMFSRHNHEFGDDDFALFMRVNKALWNQYQDKKITADELQNTRFLNWSEKLSLSGEAINQEYVNTMIEISNPIDGAWDLLQALKGKAKLAIVTNGFTTLQERRLQKTGFKEFFDHVIVAEEVGSAKPDRAIIDHTLAKMGNPRRERVLIVGDSLESDIQGGRNAEIKTCWFNAKSKTATHMKPDYEVTSLRQLHTLLGKTIQREDQLLD